MNTMTTRNPVPRSLARAAGALAAGAGAAVMPGHALGQGCPIPPSSISYFVGVNDNYQPVPEPLFHRPVLAAWLTANAPLPVNLDVNVSDRARAHTFRNLPDNIIAATLTIRMKAVSGLACNDSIHLGLNGVSGPWAWNNRIGTGNCGGPAVPGIYSGNWSTGTDQTFTLNLAALPNGNGGVVNLLPMICRWRNNLDVYVQDDTAIDYMRLDIQACCTHSVTRLRNAGTCDNYAGTTEPTWREPAFSTLVSNWRDFDVQACDRAFGHTFTNLPPGIIDAQLRICMKPFCSLAGNDGLGLEYLGWANSPPTGFAWGTVVNGSGAMTPNPGSWGPPAPGGCYTIDLTALNLLGYLADRDLDVYLQDDTDVDCLQLIMRTCSECKRRPIVVWTGATAVLLEADTGAVADPQFIHGVPLGMRRPMETIQVGEELWVSDQLADAIFRFDQGGAPVGVIRGGLDDPRGMEYAGGVVYVCNRGTDNGAPGDAVVMISPDGSIIGDFPAENPWDVQEFRGELLVSNIQQENIDCYTHEGVFLGRFHDSDGTNGIDFPTQLIPRTAAPESGLFAGGFSSPAGIYEYDAEGNQVSRIDVGTEVRGVLEMESGDLLWTNDTGVYLRDHTTGQSTLVASGEARWLSRVGEEGGSTPGPFCYADCDNSGGLDIFDFLCFQNAFAANEPNACQCDTSTGQDLCDIFDFLCFQNAFGAGCP